MAAENKRPPVTISELVQLRNFGIPADQVTWSRVTMISDQWIAVRHDGRDRKMSNVTVLNPREGTKIYAGSTFADSLIMNPSHPLIALKANLRFEVFNVGNKVLVSKTDMLERVIFWTWVNSDIIAIITDSTVYHWDLWQGDSPPENVFQRHDRLTFSEIISYKADPSLKWLAITGLTPEEDRISGVTQLYNVDEDITQCINSHAVCFTHYRFDDNPLPSTVFCVASRDTQDKGKIHIIELGPYKHGNFAPRNSYTEIQFTDDTERYDFPISIQVSEEYGLLYMVTKYGYLYLCDMETAACLCVTRVSIDIVFTSTLNSISQGILGVTRTGRILSVDIKKDLLIAQIRESAKWANQANRLERVMAVKGQNKEESSKKDQIPHKNKNHNNNNNLSFQVNNNTNTNRSTTTNNTTTTTTTTRSSIAPISSSSCSTSCSSSMMKDCSKVPLLLSPSSLPTICYEDSDSRSSHSQEEVSESDS
ncbi:clathrin heavy chain-like [Octopus vulgaris]|uniref:Clathrin heavy chain-like n=2 Tax=Octopus TaxID=6643 RepID=A0AA36F3I3_OCTVU|nr:clathrin heavy chain-like [Octopus sinensis]CAI9724356.1 clathrin heavy chain-like [Octopus vulgaris]